jgi:hypothetical protein
MPASDSTQLSVDLRIIKLSTMPGAKHRRPGPRLGYCLGYRYLCRCVNGDPILISYFNILNGSPAFFDKEVKLYS